MRLQVAYAKTTGRRLARRVHAGSDTSVCGLHHVREKGDTYYLCGRANAPLTVVFIHGFMLESAAWYLQDDFLEANYPEIQRLLIDVRGHGLAAGTPPQQCTIDGAADDVVAAINKAVPHGKIILVGHSLGGMITMNVVRRGGLGERIAGVVLCSTAIESFREDGVPQLLSLDAARRVHNAMQLAPHETQRLRDAAANLVAPAIAASVFQARSTSGELVQFHADLAHAAPLSTIIGYFHDLATHNELAAAPWLDKYPGMILVGSSDIVTPEKQSIRIDQMWNQGRLHVVPGVGHMLPLEGASALNGALGELITTVEINHRHPEL